MHPSMTSRRKGDVPGRTGHVAPDEALDPSKYIAHVEGARSVVERPDGPFDSVQEAVAWAVERAPTVLVRELDDPVIRWAGDRPLEADPDMPRWP